MPGPYEVINARVKQKIATDADWIAEEGTLGVILEGEQAFVQDANGNPVNFKIGDGQRTYSQLPFFIAYYTDVTSQKVLGFIGNENITVANQFKANTLLTDIVIYNSSGSVINLNIGLTNGGSEITTLNIPNGANSIGLKYPFSDVETVYLTGITGKQCAVFLLYIQMDQNPAIPPSQAAAFKFPAGFVGIFRPVPSLGLTYNAVWDFTNGQAKLGFGYDNCVIIGSNETPGPVGAVSIPYGPSGPGLGTTVGTSNNQYTLVRGNLPAVGLSLSLPRSHYATAGSGSDHPWGAAGPNNGIDSLTTENMGSGLAFSIQNYGYVDLWFMSIS